MKKLTIALALILCLVVAVFAFASCDKKKPASTTAAKTGATGCAHEWGDYVVDLEPTCSDAGVKSRYCTKCGAQDPASVTEIETTAHVPAAEYTTDTEPTCSDFGYKSKHCTVCGQIVASTVEQLPKDPEAHVVKDDAWTVTTEATLFQLGSRHGKCKLCGTDVVREFDSFTELTYTMSSNTSFLKEWALSDVLKEGQHFYPDASNGNKGLDLYVEFSFLWTPSLAKLTDSKNEALVLNIHPTPWANDNDVVCMALKDNANYCGGKFAGGFEYTATRTVEFGPDLMSEYVPNDGKVGTAYANFPNIGGADKDNPEYGWHRVALVIHQELLKDSGIVNKTSETPDKNYVDPASYKISCTVYIDGAKVYTLSNLTSSDFKSSTYLNNNLLYWAEPDCSEFHDAAEGEVLTAQIKAKKTSADKAYAVFADFSVTAGTAGVGGPGTAFAQSVSKNPSPAANTYTTKDGTEINAPIWYTINP